MTDLKKPTASRATRPDGSDSRPAAGIGETVRTIVYALLIAIGVRAFVIQPFNIPSGSMIPTLQVGDYLFVAKPAFGYSRFSFPFAPNLFSGRIPNWLPARGDVAVFAYTGDTSVDYIKRIVGLPGDRIQERDGQLYINDRMVQRTNDGPYSVVDENGTLLSGIRYTEALPSSTGGTPVHHAILSMNGGEGPANNTDVFVVPPEHFFAMGDNRDDSADSRFPSLGYVPIENLVGKAELIFFSIDLTHPVWEFWLWPVEIRWGRIGHWVH